jgi:hypothetical protein
MRQLTRLDAENGDGSFRGRQNEHKGDEREVELPPLHIVPISQAARWHDADPH